MTYTFKQVLLSSAKYKIKTPYGMSPEYITVHNTANDASAANEIMYHNRNDNEVSYHIAVDDKEVIQCIPFNRNAWHAGDGQGNGNRKSIGIEICYSKSGGPRYIAAEENAVQYIASLLKQFGWSINRIKKHQDWSGKYCPHRILDEKRWDSFKNRVQKALDNLSKGDGKKVNYSSPALEKEATIILADKKQREKIVLAAIAKGANKTIWTQKLIDGTLTDDDVKGLAMMAVTK